MCKKSCRFSQIPLPFKKSDKPDSQIDFKTSCFVGF